MSEESLKAREPTTLEVTRPGEKTEVVVDRVSLLLYHRDGVELFSLRESEPAVVGRGSGCHICIADRNLSRQHARFEIRRGAVTVEDLGSTNGTQLNGKRVEAATEVSHGDEIALGNLVISVHLQPGEGQQGLDSHDRFLATLDYEVIRARTFARSAALLLVRTAEGGGHVSRWAPRLRAQLRPVDRLGLYGPDVVEILAPEIDEQQAKELAQRIIGSRRRGEPPLLCGLAMFPRAASSVQELIDVARRASLGAELDQPVRVAPGHRTQVLSADGEHGHDEVVVASPAMEALYRQVDRVAPSAIPVLILGETGTGKEVLSRAIHQGGPRSDKPLRCINCAAIPESLIESVLFGHERGAFTGAEQRAVGVFEAAAGGTVLLDEIGELPAAAQSVLLRVLDSKRVTRVGSTKEVEVDVRVLAATHRNLEQMCEQGRFRADLLFRLNTMILQIPALRERTEEIIPLAERFIHNANEANGRAIQGLDPAAADCLVGYDWPGNIRELKNVIERAVVIANGELIMLEDFSEQVRKGASTPQRALADSAHDPHGGHRRRKPTVAFAGRVGSSAARAPDATVPQVKADIRRPRQEPRPALSFRERVRQYETGLLLAGLRATGGNQKEAAALLGMPLRTLVYKLRSYDLRHSELDASASPEMLQGSADLELGFRAAVAGYERRVVSEALRAAGWNKAQTARRLQIPPRTLANKIAEHGLRPDDEPG